MQRRTVSTLWCALVAAIFATTTLFTPVAIQAQATPHTNQSASALVQGPVSTTTGTAAGTFSGILKLTNFAMQNGQIVAQGLLTGTITNLDGTTSQVSQNVSAAITGASASCPILSLTLGPLHLNVLGLVIDLNQVNLNIAAQPGAGNLLGNLLCDVANLLNNGGALSAIVADLNAILKSL
jgi:hypothetical protein